MKKFILFILFLILLVCIYLIGSNLSTSKQASQSEQVAIAKVVNNYYSDLENSKYEHALTYLYSDQKDINYFMNTPSSALALSDVFHNIIIEFHRDRFCNYEDVFYDKYEKAYYAPVDLQLKYKNTTGGLVKDKLYLNKFDNQWKIVKIKSSDRYVIFRAHKYTVDSNTWFLIPTKQ